MTLRKGAMERVAEAEREIDTPTPQAASRACAQGDAVNVDPRE